MGPSCPAPKLLAGEASLWAPPPPPRLQPHRCVGSTQGGRAAHSCRAARQRVWLRPGGVAAWLFCALMPISCTCVAADFISFMSLCTCVEYLQSRLRL
ncbi:unnamed protein product [Lepidochelys kempii]